jgi:ketosteroid isomerase-like protein
MDAFTTPDGHLAPPHESRMTVVFVKGDQGWKIAHGANIDVDEGAARFDPIRGSAMLSRKP